MGTHCAQQVSLLANTSEAQGRMGPVKTPCAASTLMPRPHTDLWSRAYGTTGGWVDPAHRHPHLRLSNHARLSNALMCNWRCQCWAYAGRQERGLISTWPTRWFNSCMGTPGNRTLVPRPQREPGVHGRHHGQCPQTLPLHQIQMGIHMSSLRTVGVLMVAHNKGNIAMTRASSRRSSNRRNPTRGTSCRSDEPPCDIC